MPYIVLWKGLSGKTDLFFGMAYSQVEKTALAVFIMDIIKRLGAGLKR